MKRIMYLSIFLSLLVFTGCVTTPGKSFNDSKISQIEVNTINYEKNKHKDEIDKFEQEVIEKLKTKGYQAFLGSRIINDESFAGSAVTKLIPNSTADAFMIISAPGITKIKTYKSDTYIGETLWTLNVMYWMFNRNGERILQAPNQFLWKESSPIKRKADRISFQNETSILLDGGGKFRFLETEDEFRSRISKEFTDNIPDRQ